MDKSCRAVEDTEEIRKECVYHLRVSLDHCLTSSIARSLGSVEEKYLTCASLRNHTKRARELSSARTSVQATIAQLDLIFNVPFVRPTCAQHAHSKPPPQQRGGGGD